MVSAEHSKVTVNVQFTPESREHYGRFVNAVAGAIIDYAEHTDGSYPLFSDRYRAADTAWRELYPDSEFGHEFGQWPDGAAVEPILSEPPRRSLVREIASGVWEMADRFFRRIP